MASERIYGIDLGTTYSCIAYVDEYTKPSVAYNSEGHPTTPSVVYFEEISEEENSEKIVVGEAAKSVAVLYSDRVVSTVKRVMGDPNWKLDVDGNTHHPQDISSFILRKLVADAEAVTGDTIKEVVITCPAYFGVTEKEATRQAGQLAGLDVRYIIPEPTAAAIAYSIDLSQNQVILVFDLGGGTFDVTLIEVTEAAINVVCTGGDHDLGGKNWDETVATWFAEQFSSETGIPADNLTMPGSETWQELLTDAERAKVTLSSKTSHKQRIRHEAERALVELTREKFDELTGHLLERTMSLTEDLLAKARDKGYDRIDKLLLVGGSTYMPQVKEAVGTRFPFEALQFDPNQAVAKGAAVFGFKCEIDDDVKKVIAEKTGKSVSEVDVEGIASNVREAAEREVANDRGVTVPAIRKLTRKKISNVTSKSFGIVVLDEKSDSHRVCNLVVVDDVVPRSVARQFHTVEDDQTGILIRCMENIERLGPDDGTLLLDTSKEIGAANLAFTRPLPKSSPVEISFSLGEDGLLSVHGKDLTTHQEIDAEFLTDALLTIEEIEEKKERNMAIAVT